MSIERLTMTEKEMNEIRMNFPFFNCSVKAEANSITEKFCDKVCDEFCSDCPFEKTANKLKTYEDAEEQGLLVRLPVPIGGSVYILDYTFECKLDYKCDDPCKFKCNDDVLCEHEYKKYRIREAKFKYEMLEYIGKTAFLTREEAEAALAGMEG